MNYKEQLKDPRWQKKRLDILNGDDFTCQLCGDKQTTLHVHHIMYIKGHKAWEYEDNLLTTLCSDCHNVVHKLECPYRDIVEVSKRTVNNRAILFVRVEHLYAYSINDDKAILEMSMSNFQTLNNNG